MIGPSAKAVVLYFIIFFTHAIAHIYIAYLWVVDCRLEFPVIFISPKTKAVLHLILIKHFKADDSQMQRWIVLIIREVW